MMCPVTGPSPISPLSHCKVTDLSPDTKLGLPGLPGEPKQSQITHILELLVTVSVCYTKGFLSKIPTMLYTTTTTTTTTTNKHCCFHICISLFIFPKIYSHTQYTKSKLQTKLPTFDITYSINLFVNCTSVTHEMCNIYEDNALF